MKHMRLLTCIFLLTGLLNGTAFADNDDKNDDGRSGSISEGLARGTLSPFLELTSKVSNPGDDTLRLYGFRFGLSEGGERQLALAYYRSGSTRFDSSVSYELSYGGVVFGDPPEGDRITEGYFQMLVGTGQAKVERGVESRSSRLLFVIEPEVGLGVNLTPWLQIGAGVSYRYLNGLQVMGLGSEDLRGGTANVHLLLQL
jgi:hypothetical protein